MVIWMLTQLGRRMEELSVSFNRDIENIRKNQSELKNAINEMTNTPKEINSRFR